MSVKIAESQHGFSWESFVARVLSLDPNDVPLVTKGVQQIKKVYSKVQELLDSKIRQKRQNLIKEGDALATISPEDNCDNDDHAQASEPTCKAISASGECHTLFLCERIVIAKATKLQFGERESNQLAQSLKLSWRTL